MLPSPTKSQDSTQINSEAIYQTLIDETPNLHSIYKFKNNKISKQFYPDATSYPQFFNHNLVSPGRVIKFVEGQNALFRAFYYQLMKLAFQIEVDELDYIHVVKSVIFSPDLMMDQNASSPISGSAYSDLQYKKIIAEFMEIMISQSIPNFELTILNYPIVDEALTRILGSLLEVRNSYKGLKSLQSNVEILEYFSELFEVSMVQYGSCYKFEESDIFVLENNPSQFYIAYLNQMAEMSDGSSSSRRLSSNKQFSSSALSSNQKIRKSERRNLSNLSESAQKSDQNESIYERVNMNGLNVQANKIDIKPYSSHEVAEKANEISEYRSIQRQQQRHVMNEQSNSKTVQGSNNLSSLAKDGVSTKVLAPYVPMASKFKEFSKEKEGFQTPLKSSLASKGLESDDKVIGYANEQQRQATKLPAVHAAVNNFNSHEQTEASTPNEFNYNKPIFQMQKIESPMTLNLDINKDERLSKEQKSNYTAKPLYSDKIITNYTQSGFQLNPKSQNPSSSNYYSSFAPTSLFSGYGKNAQTWRSSQMSEKSAFNLAMGSEKSSTQMISSQDPSIIDRAYKSSFQEQQNNEEFYRPFNAMDKKRDLLNTNQNVYEQKLNSQPDESVGTLYRQFTNTKIMEVMPAEIQSNIRRMRGKFRGKHSKDINKFF